MHHLYLEIIKQYLDANSVFDVAAMLALVHPEIHYKVIHQGKLNVHTTGKKEFERVSKNSIPFFKEREQKVRAYTIDENIVNIEIDFHAVMAKDLSNGVKRSENIELRGVSEYIFKEGLIFSIVEET